MHDKKICFAACPQHVIAAGRCECNNQLFEEANFNTETDRTKASIDYYRMMNGMQPLPDFATENPLP